MSDIDHMDGWLTSSYRWSWAFKGPMCHRYDNAQDRRSLPGSLVETTFPGVPLNQTDSDEDLGREMWTIYKGNDMWLYHQEQKRIYPGYPKPIHQDELDGGLYGANRTRCSGRQELSTLVGFIEDKERGAEFRAMPYAADLHCEWTVTAPANLVKQQASNVSWGGMQLLFTRFDLGEHAQLYVYEDQDMPSPAELFTMSTSNYRLDGDDSSYAADMWDIAIGPFQLPDETPPRRLVAQSHPRHLQLSSLLTAPSSPITRTVASSGSATCTKQACRRHICDRQCCHHNIRYSA
jgi:hypothetical protein